MEKPGNTMEKLTKWDRDHYMKEASHYYALGLAESLSGKVGLWFDKSGDGKMRLVHAFVEIYPGLYLDAYGFFRNIAEREQIFPCGEKAVGTYTIEEAKRLLHSASVTYGDRVEKRKVEALARAKLWLMRIRYENTEFTVGLTGKVSRRINDVLVTYLVLREYSREYYCFTNRFFQVPCKEADNCIVQLLDIVPYMIEWGSKV